MEPLPTQNISIPPSTPTVAPLVGREQSLPSGASWAPATPDLELDACTAYGAKTQVHLRKRKSCPVRVAAGGRATDQGLRRSARSSLSPTRRLGHRSPRVRGALLSRPHELHTEDAVARRPIAPMLALLTKGLFTRLEVRVRQAVGGAR